MKFTSRTKELEFLRKNLIRQLIRGNQDRGSDEQIAAQQKPQRIDDPADRQQPDQLRLRTGPRPDLRPGLGLRLWLRLHRWPPVKDQMSSMVMTDKRWRSDVVRR